METNYSSVPLNPATVETALRRVSFLRRHKSLLIALLSILVSLFSLTMAFHAFVAWKLARPHIDALKSNPLKAFGAPYENVTFPGLDVDSQLSGWFIPAETGKALKQTVVFSHGYGGNREEIWVPLYDLAKTAHQMGFDVLMFDYGYVQPQLNATGGLRESHELLGAVRYAKDRGADRVFIWGFSMGAGTALQAALQTRDIDGMILDSTFILEPDTLYHNMKQMANLPKFSQPLVHMFFPLLNGVSLNQIPYTKVKETEYTIPILFIHGKKDLKAPYEITEEIYENQGSESGSQLWLLPNDGHELIYKAHKRDYLQMTSGYLRTVSTMKLAPIKYSTSR